MGDIFETVDGKVDFAGHDFLVNFFLKNALAVDGEEGFAVFFVTYGFNYFEFKLYVGVFLL